MPFPVLAALAAVQAGQKLYQSYEQDQAANKAKLQNTQTAGEREQLAMSRQAATNAQMPGLGASYNRLNQGLAATQQAARLGATSGGDYLAAVSAADANRVRGQAGLAVQGLQYLDRSKMQLRQDLSTNSARQQRDLDNYNREKAALTQASAENLNNGLSTVANYGALAYNGQEAAKDRAAYGVTPPTGALGEVAPIDYRASTPSPIAGAPLPAALPYYQERNGAPSLGRYRYNLGNKGRRSIGF